jgi:hypothetical protein
VCMCVWVLVALCCVTDDVVVSDDGVLSYTYAWLNLMMKRGGEVRAMALAGTQEPVLIDVDRGSSHPHCRPVVEKARR